MSSEDRCSLRSDDQRRNMSSSTSQVHQLFARLAQEIEEKNPTNPIFFTVDFLCKHYPQHLCGFASVWNANPELEKDRLLVVEFFRFQKLPTEVASHFTNAGFDTLETLCSLTSETLQEIERFNATQWLPGHKVRLQQTFSDIASRVRAFRQEREKMMQIARLANGYCDHPTVLTRTNVGAKIPAIQYGPNPVPTHQPVAVRPSPITVQPASLTGVSFGSPDTMIPSKYSTSISRPLVVTPM